MIGINIDGINLTIKKNDNYHDMFQSNINSIVENINELNYFYYGNDIDYLFYELVEEIDFLKSITWIINNYSDVLINVINAYEAQDLNIKYQLDTITSNTNIL